MKAETILVPIDFTPCSEAALDAATTMARGSGGKLFVVYVEEPWNAVNGPDYLYTVPEPSPDEALRRLRAVLTTTTFGTFRASSRHSDGFSACSRSVPTGHGFDDY
jgi:nucleotide-binding universal stress UspA family protein